MRTLVILADGMRPDALGSIEKAKEYMGKCRYTLEGVTVMPSVTLPCHMSLFHSVDPLRHGTTTNIYAPQVRPIKGLCEVLLENGKKSAFFYNWEELRDLTRPNSLTKSYFVKGRDIGYDKAGDIITDEAIKYLNENYVDFTFLYMGYPDAAGHNHGWMGEEYMESLNSCFDNIDRLIKSLPDDYVVIITADHGGHGRTHGTDMPEDMTIPMFVYGKGIEPGNTLGNISIKDIAPTVVKLLGVEPDSDWEGKSFL